MVLFVHYLTYKILFFLSVAPNKNVYDYVYFWGSHSVSLESPLTVIFYIYILLMGYILVEARSDWPLFPRFRNIIIYGVTLIITLQGIIGLDIIPRFSPFNPQQSNRTYFLYDAIVKNDLAEVKRLIANGYDPFGFSLGQKDLVDDYRWFEPAFWINHNSWVEWAPWDQIPYYKNTPSIFSYASVSGIEGASKSTIYWYREDHLHPYKPETFPKFDHRIFNFLLTLNPTRSHLQQAVSDLSLSGNTIALVKILNHNKTLSPTFKNIEGSLLGCYADTSAILLERLFDKAEDPNQTNRLLWEKFGHLNTDYSPCTAPLRKYLVSEEYAIP